MILFCVTCTWSQQLVLCIIQFFFVLQRAIGCNWTKREEARTSPRNIYLAWVNYLTARGRLSTDFIWRFFLSHTTEAAILVVNTQFPWIKICLLSNCKVAITNRSVFCIYWFSHANCSWSSAGLPTGTVKEYAPPISLHPQRERLYAHALQPFFRWRHHHISSADGKAHCKREL